MTNNTSVVHNTIDKKPGGPISTPVSSSMMNNQHARNSDSWRHRKNHQNQIFSIISATTTLWSSNENRVISSNKASSTTKRHQPLLHMHNHHLLLSPPPKRNHPRHQLLSKLTSLFSCQWDSTASSKSGNFSNHDVLFVGVCGIRWRGNDEFLMLVDVSKKAYQNALTVKEKKHNCTRSV